ncbi:MAG: FHA domain-containing protein [Ignavibacteriae bacterium]|nr:MAG: FHA domain-containing protein [Ignavibacteriota bacterium]
MNCPNCNKPNIDSAAFCAHCGTRLEKPLSSTLNYPIVTVGRGSDNTISITSEGVSSHHARIFVQNGKVTIEDLNSTNGTFVNGNKIIRTEIMPGDRINFGMTVLDTSIPEVRNLFNMTVSPQVVQNKTYVESVVTSQTPQQFPVSMPQQIPQQPLMQQQIVQQTSQVVYQGSPKSVGVAITLAIFFGPLGMLYSTITGGLVMLGVSLLLGILTFGFSFFFTHPVCVVWAALAADAENKKINVTTATQSTNVYRN